MSRSQSLSYVQGLALLRQQEVKCGIAPRQSSVPPPASATMPLVNEPDPDSLITDFLDQIRRLATQHGWRGEHSYTATGPDRGVQCLLVREVLIIARLATDDATLTPSQSDWLDALRRVPGVEVYVWRPHDADAIRTRLSRRTTP